MTATVAEFHEKITRLGYVVFASGGWYRVPDELIPVAREAFDLPQLGVEADTEYTLTLLDLHPGDVLAITTPEPLTQRKAHEIKRAVADKLPGVEIVVFGAATPTVIRSAP